MDYCCRTRVLATIVCALAGWHAAAAQPEPVRIWVHHPRPVSEAVRQIEKHFRRVITYEDISYVHPDDIEDVTEQVRRDGNLSKRVLAMRREAIDVTFTPRGSDIDKQIEGVLQQVVADARVRGNTGDFHIDRRPGAFHVLPIARKGTKGELEPYSSPLETRVTLPHQDETAGEWLMRLTREVSRVWGRELEVGIMPINLMVQRRVSIEAHDERARDVLWRALQSLGRPLSWQLLCGVGEQAFCALNIHIVE